MDEEGKRLFVDFRLDAAIVLWLAVTIQNKAVASGRVGDLFLTGSKESFLVLSV